MNLPPARQALSRHNLHARVAIFPPRDIMFPAISNFSRHLKHSQMSKHWLQKSRDKELARMCPALVWVYMLKEYSAFSSLLRDDTITSNYNTSFLNC